MELGPMSKKISRSWKKVFEADLAYVVSELRETIERPALIVLEGDLGAGKTTFCKFFIGDEQVQSPTYSIVSETQSMVHADFYRLQGSEELTQLELNLYLDGKDFLLVEWGKKYLGALNRELDEKFTFYELKIDMNGSTKNPSRDYSLQSLERN